MQDLNHARKLLDKSQCMTVSCYHPLVNVKPPRSHVRQTGHVLKVGDKDLSSFVRGYVCWFYFIATITATCFMALRKKKKGDNLLFRKKGCLFVNSFLMYIYHSFSISVIGREIFITQLRRKHLSYLSRLKPVLEKLCFHSSWPMEPPDIPHEWVSLAQRVTRIVNLSSLKSFWDFDASPEIGSGKGDLCENARQNSPQSSLVLAAVARSCHSLSCLQYGACGQEQE